MLLGPTSDLFKGCELEHLLFLFIYYFLAVFFFFVLLLFVANGNVDNRMYLHNDVTPFVLSFFYCFFVFFHFPAVFYNINLREMGNVLVWV